jgi:hypothetical protein
MTKETSQRAYFTLNGQIGKRTTERTKMITRIVMPRLDSVVSNRKEAYFLSRFVGGTGYRFFGYLILIPSGLLKKTNSAKAFFAKALKTSSF